jgi:hypothetical protein
MCRSVVGYGALVSIALSAWPQIALAADSAMKPTTLEVSSADTLADRIDHALPAQISGFLQIDLIHAADSQDQLNDANQLGTNGVLNNQGQVGGASGQSSDGNALVLNQNRFLLRRARLRLADRFRSGHFSLDYGFQVDANSIAGLNLGFREAEVGVAFSPQGFGASADSDPRGPNVFRARLGAGVFRAPFGYDVFELTHTDRLFSEPSLLANAFFPGDFDLGARLDLHYGDLNLTVALQNGEPIGERSFPGRDTNAAKDWFVRLAGKADPIPRLSLEGGLSMTRGSGFHAGTPPTKDNLVWRDFNEDGAAQQAEIQVIRGASPTASENFERWAIGADVRARLALPWGSLTLFGEGATGVNIDRGIRPADPIISGAPQRGITIHGGFLQNVGKYLTFGARADHYDARLDSSDLQGGKLVRVQRPFTYYSLAAAVRLFERESHRGRARLMVEYGHRIDNLALDAAGRPTDLSDNRFTARMQAEF